MKQANRILQLLTYDFPEVEPVVRHGRNPEFISIEKEGWEEKLIELIEGLKGKVSKRLPSLQKR